MAGQSDSPISLFSPEEVEFMAEDELMEIVPNMRMDPLNFICVFSEFAFLYEIEVQMLFLLILVCDNFILWLSCFQWQGDFGPFFPQIPVKVPLWLAVALKKRGKCTIRPPQWMSVENLTQVLEGEREDQGTFQAVPFHYIEISKLLFDHAREDIPDIYMVRSLIEDIRDVRLHKVETNLEKFSATSAVKIAHLSAMEVNIVRPFVVRTLQAFYKHDNPVVMADLDSMSNRQPQVRQPQVPNNARRQPLKRR